ncbi:flagellar hook capping FlgD N-terminal domain-containing protein [Caminibacter sp.]
MAINTVNTVNQTTTNDTVYNPNSKLDKDAFLKLFLTQLEMQDPTDPMDTDKMLEQTAYLSTMEMNNNMQKTLDNLSNTLSKTSELGVIGAIGKMADTGNRNIVVSDKDTDKKFELYFGDNISSGKVLIKDKNGNVVKEFNLEAHDKGILTFDWDLKDNNGQRVPSDTYTVEAQYTSPDGKDHTTALGAYPIESIKFENGTPYAKLGSNYVPFDEIKEIYEWQG